MKKNSHLGSDFDDFLREEGILEEVEAVAMKQVLAWQIQREMRRKKLSKAALASKMKTSRAALDRLLDPRNDSLTLRTLARAAEVLGKKFRVALV